MTILRPPLPLALVSAMFLAAATAAEPPRAGPGAPVPAEDGALDAAPAPGSEAAAATPEKARKPAELPPAARTGVWRGGAKRPGDAPPAAVVRAAQRKPSPNAKSRQRSGPEAEASRTIEIVWNAPGS